jgi:hypothetical protein
MDRFPTAIKDPAGRELVEALLEGYADTLQKNFPRLDAAGHLNAATQVEI